MTTTSVSCLNCGKGQSFQSPDDHDGTRIVWECSDCGARNATEGVHPTEVQPLSPPLPEGVVAISDTDEGKGKTEQ